MHTRTKGNKKCTRQCLLEKKKGCTLLLSYPLLHYFLPRIYIPDTSEALRIGRSRIAQVGACPRHKSTRRRIRSWCCSRTPAGGSPTRVQSPYGCRSACKTETRVAPCGRQEREQTRDLLLRSMGRCKCVLELSFSRTNPNFSKGCTFCHCNPYLQVHFAAPLTPKR